MAGDYFRSIGDYENTIKCYQRAIYYSSSTSSNSGLAVSTLSLSNLLHKLHFINDSLSVALSSLTFDPNNKLFAYHIGNIFVVNFFIFFCLNK